MIELDICPDLNYKLKPNMPVLTELKSQKMVTVLIEGDPNEKTALLMPPLYATAYAIRKAYKEQGQVFKVEKLRARWPQAQLEQPKGQWRGIYALPVPHDVAQLPVLKKEKNPQHIPIFLETWDYGKVAMILHVGSYATENDTVQLLLNFVKDSGQSVIAHSHEEIYLSDPNKTVAEKLRTIILYRLA